MTNREFQEMEQFMLQCMNDSAHDREHGYRVLYKIL